MDRAAAATPARFYGDGSWARWIGMGRSKWCSRRSSPSAAAITAAGTSAVKNRTAMMVISVSAHVVGLIHQRLSEHRAAMRPCPRTPNYFGYGRFTRGGACLVRPRCGVAPRRKTSGPEATDSSVGWVSHDGLADDSVWRRRRQGRSTPSATSYGMRPRGPAGGPHGVDHDLHRLQPPGDGGGADEVSSSASPAASLPW